MSTGTEVTTPAPAEAYGAFMGAIDELLGRGIDRLEQRGRREIPLLREHSGRVMERLRSEDAIRIVAGAFESLDPLVSAALCAELHFITSNISEGGYLASRSQGTGHAETDPEADADAEAAGDAKTGKDSLESLLGTKLPKWLAHLLKVLNELLSIVFKA